MSSQEGSLQPAWDADSNEPSDPPAEDLYAETGIANLKGPARFTIACLGFFIAFRLVGVLGYGLVENARHSSGDFLDIAKSLSGMAGLVGWGLGLPLVICIILGFLVWLVGAASNAETIDEVNLRISPGWQAGWYFAPFFNLIMPALGMHEVVSHSHVRRPDLAFLVTTLWWSTWLLGTLGIHIVRTSGLFYLSDAGYLSLTILEVTAAVLTSSAAVLLIILIRTVTRGQTAFAERVLLAGEEEDPFEILEP